MFEILQHTADVRLRVRAGSVEELFRDSLRGMFAVECGGLPPPSKAAASRRTPIVIESVDRTTLLVDFLNDALTRAHIERIVFRDVSFEKLAETDLVAELAGGPAQVVQEIKAVTYHEADVRQTDGAWETMLVFDI